MSIYNTPSVYEICENLPPRVLRGQLSRHRTELTDNTSVTSTMAFGIIRLLSLLLASTAAFGQLSGSVGPTTSRSAKQATICNVLNYGGSIGSSVRCFPPFLCIEYQLRFSYRLGYRACYCKRIYQLCSQKLWFYALRSCWKLQYADLGES